ncbi:ATP-binding cassette domain-containing protein [Streptomyces sp. NPDC090053]|uniref:ATP-binding cassette domain-containing protein n=1 Tax=Streptomyces sp. NPDC090053 TaxID=3365932 RepID=UPI0037F3895A
MTGDAAAALTLRQVGRRYGLGGPWVLRAVDLDLPARSLVRIEGRNGSGKSTLLRLLAGIDAPTTGRITGRPRTAYVPERFPAALPFTALGYLVHLGRIHGLRRATAAARAAEWLERFGAAGHARTPLAELSKGTSQKVAVAQALLAEPELLILDEAWTGLDTGARAELDRAVTERIGTGATVVFVDHDPQRLADAVDLGLRVTDGALVRVGAPPETSGPTVRIEAAGPPGSALPARLPGSPVCETGTDSSVLTVPAAHSDALLRALLTARPPWHIRAVHGAGSRTPDSGTPASRTAGIPPSRTAGTPASRTAEER